MATVTTLTNGAAVALTLDVSSLATSASGLAGVESSQVDDSASGSIDRVVSCDGILSNATTGPAVGQNIIVYAWGSDVSLATTPIDGLDGVTGAATLAHAQVLNALKPIAIMAATTTTVGFKYYMAPTSLAQFFGGVLPKFWGLYVTHNQTAALAAAQAALFSHYAVTFTTT